MIQNKNVETIKADEFINVHVVPKENDAFSNKKYICTSKVMGETWRSCLRDQSKYKTISPKRLRTSINRMKYAYLNECLEERYWK